MLHVLLAVLAAGSEDRDVEFQPPTPVLVNGSSISVAGGHAAPVCADLDGDGAADLLVGQFSGGGALLFLNKGTTAAPKLDEGWPFVAGAEVANVDFG